MSTEMRSPFSSTIKMLHQEQFSRVATFLKAALLLGAGGGFLLATALTLSAVFNIPTGAWWSATAQAHGHLQLYGWAGLFVLGVALHFLPRLRGNPLAYPWLLPWILTSLVVGLLLRAVSQPLQAATGALLYGVLLITSGVLECLALLTVFALLAITARRGPRLSARPALTGVFPFFVLAFSSLAGAACVNLLNVILAMPTNGFIPGPNDDLNVELGLFGFLLPIALAMSAQALPMYAGLEAFPRRLLWPLTAAYLTGLLLACFGAASGSRQGDLVWMLAGLGWLLIGCVLLSFVSVFLLMMRKRGNLPQRVKNLAPSAEKAVVIASRYRQKIRKQRSEYGPFVGLVASAYLWACLGGLLLLADGLTMLLGLAPLFALDAVRHSLTIGFIALLICGIAPRMLPGFSGGKIVSAKLVTATLWLGNAAALLRVGSIIFAPLLTAPLLLGGFSLYTLLFGLSGPLGLALAICLAVNLWPALNPPKRAQP